VEIAGPVSVFPRRMFGGAATTPRFFSMPRVMASTIISASLQWSGCLWEISTASSFWGFRPAFREYMRAPGPGSIWMLRRLDRMRIPPVCRFWVMVVNLPPPVPRNTISVSFIFLHRGHGR
jgi:hypothetical protein